MFSTQSNLKKIIATVVKGMIVTIFLSRAVGVNAVHVGCNFVTFLWV